MSGLADFLDSRRELIVASFEGRVRSDAAVRGVRAVLDQLVARARGRVPGQLALPTEDLGALVGGYPALQEAIFELMAGPGLAFPDRELRALTRALVSGLAAAAAQLAEVREAELRRKAAEEMAFLAHELRNPLTSMRLAFGIALKGSEVTSTRAIALVHSGIARLTDQIDVALLKSRLEAQLEHDLVDIPVPQLITEVLADATLEVEAKGLRIQVEAVTAAILHGDKRVLLSALSNLLRNAVKFSPPGAAITVRVHELAGRVVIEIEDQCGGLPPGQCEKLFEPFVQSGSDRSGFGLGLAITRQAAEAHGGAVRVRDLPARGCVFVLELPVKTSSRGESAAAAR